MNNNSDINNSDTQRSVKRINPGRVEVLSHLIADCFSGYLSFGDGAWDTVRTELSENPSLQWGDSLFPAETVKELVTDLFESDDSGFGLMYLEHFEGAINWEFIAQVASDEYWSQISEEQFQKMRGDKDPEGPILCACGATH